MTTKPNEWMSDPLVCNIPQEKLDFLQMLVFESKTLSRQQMAPFLMSIARKGKSQHISFNEEEIEAIVTALRKYSSPEEVAQINKLMSARKQNPVPPIQYPPTES